MQRVLNSRHAVNEEAKRNENTKKKTRKKDSNKPIAIIAVIAIGPATNGSNWKNEEATHRKQLKKWEKKNNKKEAKMKRTNFFHPLLLLLHHHRCRCRRRFNSSPLAHSASASIHWLSGDTISTLIYGSTESAAPNAKENWKKKEGRNNERERKIPMSDDVKNTCALWTAYSSSHKT